MTPPPSLQDLIDTGRQDADSGNALDQLAAAAATVAQIEDTSDALLGHFVDRCRREGRSWSEISAALGVTKQAVHKRFATSVADQIIASIPAPTLERFTARARVVLASAALAARDAGRGKAAAVHILIGLFAEPEGVAAKVLQELGVTRDAVRTAALASPAAEEPDAAVEPSVPDPAGGASPPIPRFTADGRLALRDALAAALELGHNYIGTEHLLLALYRNANSAAAAILVAAGATEPAARAGVLEQLRGYSPPKPR
jgi:ATP-dependent Clp protease ATP-binding subunit ClpA